VNRQKVLVLDIDGPLGEVSKLWVQVLREMELGEEDKRKREELIDIFKKKEYKRDIKKYNRIVELVDHFM